MKYIIILITFFIYSSTGFAQCPNRFSDTNSGRTEEWLQVMESGVSLFLTEPEYRNFYNSSDAIVRAMQEALRFDFNCESLSLAEELADDAVVFYGL